MIGKCCYNVRSLFAKLNEGLPAFASRSERSDRYNVGVIGQVNKTPIHSYTQGPQETSLLVHSGSALWRRQAKVPLVRVQRLPRVRSSDA